MIYTTVCLSFPKRSFYFQNITVFTTGVEMVVSISENMGQTIYIIFFYHKVNVYPH